MKTGLPTLFTASLLFAACNERPIQSARETGSDRTTRRASAGILLVTDLPQARLEGTQPPVRLPLRTPGYNHQ